MSAVFDYLFGAASFMPHGYCLLWRPDLVAMHGIADFIIAVSYFSIPAVIYIFIKRRDDIEFGFVPWLFVGFITACGLTHVLGLVTLWQPLYGLQGMMKLMTAGISLLTATLLWPLLPQALAVPSPVQLRLANDELAQVNAEHQQTLVRLQSILDNTADALLTIDENGRIEDYNRACERMFGYAADAAIGLETTALLDLGAGDGQPGGPLAVLENCAGGDAPMGIEITGRRRDGSSVPLEITVSQIRLSDRRLFSVILRDVSEHKSAEAKREELIAELKASNRELARRNRDLDDFAYIASHDLREPLRAVYSHASILLDDHADKLDDDGEQRLHRVIALSRRLEKLIADLLYFSRLGRGELGAETIDPKALIADIESDHAEVLEERGARIEIAHDLPMIEANPLQMTTLFQNLIMNGIKYNDAEDKLIEIGFLPALEHDGKVHADVLFVRDNGIGIKDRFKEDVFRIFKRLNKEKLYGAGTGAGLTFAKKIVEKHGGEIWLQSEFGEGTTFYFTLKTSACRKAA